MHASREAKSQHALIETDLYRDSVTPSSSDIILMGKGVTENSNHSQRN